MTATGLGMLVMQDFVNNGHYSFLRDTALPTVWWGFRKFPDKLIRRTGSTRTHFLQAMEATVQQLDSHPCIVYWTIFNEGWGQFDASVAYRHLKGLDSTRFVDSASGWFKGRDSDVISHHVYFKPFVFVPGDKPVVLSEFGGYAYKPTGHAANTEKTYSYRDFQDREAYQQALLTLYRQEILPAIPQGLCGAVYTQLSDVEDEVNGLVSYDRKVVKVDPEALRKCLGENPLG